ncbi:MAG: hypothetical protein HQL63_06305 [Magnetococcales bacterium]|nr:hypothetical protein [Magnetococcales bacterium]MBF0321953.1 hypothetical protein [Magnetococcales bacterium]
MDPDAQAARLKDGSTHFAYKPGHAVDLETGAVVALEKGSWKSRIAEPERSGVQHWRGDDEARRTVYNNRIRFSSEIGKAMMRERDELFCSSFWSWLRRLQIFCWWSSWHPCWSCKNGVFQRAVNIRSFLFLAVQKETENNNG